MRNLYTLAIAAVAAMALMAFAASSASATALYNGTTKLGVGSTLKFSLKSGTSANLVETSEPGGEGKSLDTCKGSAVEGSITNAGGAGDVEGNNAAGNPTWTTCTFTTTTNFPGGLKVASTGGTNGAVNSAAEIGVTINTVFFGSCVYGVPASQPLGTISSSASGTALFSANSVVTKRSGSNFACPKSAVWTAEYVSTTPDNLRVEAS